MDSDLQTISCAPLSLQQGRGEGRQKSPFLSNFCIWNSMQEGLYGFDTPNCTNEWHFKTWTTPWSTFRLLSTQQTVNAFVLPSPRMRTQRQDLTCRIEKRPERSEMKREMEKTRHFSRYFYLHQYSFFLGLPSNQADLICWHILWVWYSFCCNTILEKFGGQRNVFVRLLLHTNQFSTRICWVMEEIQIH